MTTMIASQCIRRTAITSILSVPVRHFLYRRGYIPTDVEPGSYPFPKRQIPLCGLKPYKERIKEIKKLEGLESLEPIDIGLPYKHVNATEDGLRTKNPVFELAARKRTLKVPIDLVHSSSEDSDAPNRRILAAKHYDIFHSLFGPPHFFVPQVPIGIFYVAENVNDQQSSTDAADVQPVYTGNFLSPSVAQQTPLIDLSAVPKGYQWTLIMTSPDAPITMNENIPACNEYINWMVCNLGHCTSSQEEEGGEQGAVGDEIVPYLPPLPYQGSGYHRYIFTLYRQDKGPIDLSSDFPKDQFQNRDIHASRRFSSLDFYRHRQDELTPAGLAFFQAAWDPSVRAYFRTELEMKEPIFELHWPTPRLPPQERFPVANSWTRSRRHPHGLPLIRERHGVHNDVSFDVYLDRYRDRRELEEEIILLRLASEGNPLAARSETLEFPNAVPMPSHVPSWWKRQEERRRLRQGRWKLLEGHDG